MVKARPRLQDTQPALLTTRGGHGGGQALGWRPLCACAQACCAVHGVYVCSRVCCMCLCTGVQRCVPLACLLDRVGSPEIGVVHFLDGAPGVQKSFSRRQLVCRRQKRELDSGQRKSWTPGARPPASALTTLPQEEAGRRPAAHSSWPLVRQALSRVGLQRAQALSTAPLTPSLQAALLTELPPGLTVPS